MDFNDPGLDTVQELCFDEPPTSGTFTVSIMGVESDPIPFDATAADLEEILNNVKGVANKVTVTGSFADCFTITFKNLAVPAVAPGSNSLVGPSGPVGLSVSVMQAGRNPANTLTDRDGRPITVTVTNLVEGRRNDLCGE
jgi:hypothetical protein